MIREDDMVFLVFTKCTKEDCGPTTYFYDVEKSMTKFKIPGAELFIDYFSNPENSKEDTKDGAILFMSSKNL